MWWGGAGGGKAEAQQKLKRPCCTVLLKRSAGSMGRRAEVCGGEWGGEGEGVGGGWERRLNPSRGTHYKALLCPADASVTGMKRPGGGGEGCLTSPQYQWIHYLCSLPPHQI